MAVASVPDWVTTSFFQRWLEAHENQPLTVTKYTVKPTDIPDGNNYGSQIIRVTVDYDMGDTKTSTTLIMKCPVPIVEQFAGHVYEVEESFYKIFLKETCKYRGKLDFIPKHYVSPLPRIVILEDLCTSGYEMVDRHALLDFEHCQLFIKSKAKLHALSVAVHKENPEIIEALVEESLTFKAKKTELEKQIMKSGMECVIAYLEDNYSDNYEYMDIIKEVSNNNTMWEMYQEIEDSSSNKSLKVLIQCDPWCTNMMFKYDDSGKVENIKLLDFQALEFSSPLKEIVTFMSLCPKIEVRKAKSIELFHLYSDTLNENLADLQCHDRLNFEEIMSEVATMAPWILYLICCSMPLLIAEGAADFNELLSGNVSDTPVRETSMYKLYQTATFKRLFPQLIDTIAKQGVFDFVREKIKERKSN